MVESNKLKKYFNIGRDNIPLGEQKIYIQWSFWTKTFWISDLKKKKINPNNLIYKYKTEGISL